MVENINREMLGNSACILLQELIKVAEFLGENFTKYILFNDNDNITMINQDKDMKIQYSMSEVSYILSDNIDGFWKADKSLVEYAKYLEKSLEDRYEKLEQYEFLTYCKNVYHLKYKIKEIYGKLREIESMV